MFDEMDRLRDEKDLFALLSHYAAAPGRRIRRSRRDRLLQMDGVEDGGRAMRLHGELLACGWLEPNTGLTPVLRRGEAPAVLPRSPQPGRAAGGAGLAAGGAGFCGRTGGGAPPDVLARPCRIQTAVAVCFMSSDVIGSLTVNVAPFPTRLSTRMRPRC